MGEVVSKKYRGSKTKAILSSVWRNMRKTVLLAASLMTAFLLFLAGCGEAVNREMLEKTLSNVEKHSITNDETFIGGSLLGPAKGYSIPRKSEYPVPDKIGHENYENIMQQPFAICMNTRDYLVKFKNTHKDANLYDFRATINPYSIVLKVDDKRVSWVGDKKVSKKVPHGAIFDSKRKIYGEMDRDMFACWDVDSDNIFWSLRLGNSKMLGFSYKTSLFIVVDSKKLLSVGANTGLPNWMVDFGGKTIEDVYDCDEYLWVIVQKNFYDKDVYRINLEKNKISQLNFPKIQDFFVLNFLENKVYLLHDNNKVVTCIDPETGLKEKDYKFQVGKNYGRFLSKKTDHPLSFRMEEKYYLINIFLPEKPTRLPGRLSVVENDDILKHRDYYFDDGTTIYGVRADNGDKKWRIKRDLLAKNPRVILSAYSRIVVVDSEGLAYCGY